MVQDHCDPHKGGQITKIDVLLLLCCDLILCTLAFMIEILFNLMLFFCCIAI